MNPKHAFQIDRHTATALARRIVRAHDRANLIPRQYPIDLGQKNCTSSGLREVIKRNGRERRLFIFHIESIAEILAKSELPAFQWLARTLTRRGLNS